MGAYYDSSYCGNDALQYELSAPDKVSALTLPSAYNPCSLHQVRLQASHTISERAGITEDETIIPRPSAPLPAKSKERRGKKKSAKGTEVYSN